MPKLPTVSVIIPTYNRAHLVGKAIQSVLNQTYQDFEVIIVDDGSTDNTEEVVKSLDDPRVHYIRHKENRGGSEARNTGIEHAKGKYLTFLDSDDWLTSMAMKMQVDMLETTGADVCYGDWRRAYESSIFPHYSDEIFSAAPMPDPIASLLGNKWCPPFCYLIRRKAVVNINGWNNDYKALQDRDFVVRIAFNRSRFVHYKGVVGYYFQHHEYRVSRSNRIRWLTFMKRHIFDSARWLTLNNEWNKERRHAIALSLFRHAQRYYGIDKNQFQECLKKTIEILPDFNAPRKYYRILVAILGYYRAETIRRIILKIFFRNKM